MLVTRRVEDEDEYSPTREDCSGGPAATAIGALEVGALRADRALAALWLAALANDLAVGLE